MTAATHSVDLAGVGPAEVSVAEYGSGQPFLLLHGGAGPQSATGFAERFAAAHAVRVPNMQVVMNADEAAELTAILKPELAVPHHYAFTKGFLGDRLITDSDKNPLHFQDASHDLAPETTVRIVNPVTRIEL